MYVESTKWPTQPVDTPQHRWRPTSITACIDEWSFSQRLDRKGIFQRRNAYARRDPNRSNRGVAKKRGNCIGHLEEPKKLPIATNLMHEFERGANYVLITNSNGTVSGAIVAIDRLRSAREILGANV